MELQNPVALPQGSGALGCRICGCLLGNREEFLEHHRAPWHLYNMRRRSQQLPAVTLLEFERKKELLRLARQYAEGTLEAGPLGGPPAEAPQQGSLEHGKTAAAFHAAVRCNRKGTDHLKKHKPEMGEGEGQPEATAAGAAEAEKAAAAKAAAAAWRAALQQHPERCNLFQQMPAFGSAAQNLEYMKTAYGFFIPDEEYCTNPEGLLRCLWRQQQQQPSCLFCCRRFRGIRAALQHMQQQRHFQLKFDAEQQDLLARFYDYKKSYYDLMERLPGKAISQLAAPEVPSETESEGAAAAAGDTDADEGDWEYCTSDEENDAKHEDQQKLEAMLRARGWNCARVTEEGHLQLPNGQEVLHRDCALFCRQRLRLMEPRRAEQCVLQDKARVYASLPFDGSSKASLLLHRREKLQRHLGIRSGALRQRQRLLLPQQQRRLILQREAEQQQRQQELMMKIGIKTNKLQKTMLRQTKCFL